MTEEASDQKPLFSGRLLAKNALWNLLGQGAPLLAAVFAIPVLIDRLGTDRFGILTLAWMVIGYFSLFDLGLGRALTKLVADKIGAGKEREIPALAWTALGVMLLLSLIGVLVIWVLTPWLVHRALKIPSELQAETIQSFYWLAVSIPFVISTTGLRGILEAYQRFGLINAVRIPMGLFTFVGPLLVLPFSERLTTVVAVLVVGRAVAWVIHATICLRVVPGLRRTIDYSRSEIRPLLAFGGWMTITNVVGPLMVYLDRFLIGAVLSVAAVAYYSTPYEVITKLLVIPSALVGVLFPAFASSLVLNRQRAAILYSRGLDCIALAQFPLALLMVIFSKEILQFWLGVEFAESSFLVLKWLAIGIFLNGLAQVPFALIQAAGRPDLTAKLHLFELPFYLLFLWWAINSLGIVGAAISWTIRVLVDSIVLIYFSVKCLPQVLDEIGVLVRKKLALLLVLIGGFYVDTLVVKELYVIIILICFFVASWINLKIWKKSGFSLFK